MIRPTGTFTQRVPPRGRRCLLTLVAAALCGSMAWSASTFAQDAASLQLRKGDSIVFIGNTFAERMHLFGYFESFLHSKFPDHRLRVRNMGWSADEVALRPRPRGFGDRHRYLEQEKADVIFCCFGMNESFLGPSGLERFKRDLVTLIDDLQAHRYNGRSAPRIVLVSPIAHEDVGGLLPDGKEHNRSLELYTEALAETARQRALVFVDLLGPTRELMSASPKRKLTFNGIHLTAFGYWRVSQILAQSLGLVDNIAPPHGTGPQGAGSQGTGPSISEDLRRAVYDKNYSFFFHWRPPNMEYIHGRRKDRPGAERLAEEQKQLYNIVGQLDEIIWRSPKPAPQEFWRRLPPTRPLWATTPEYKGITIPDIGPVRLTRREPDRPRTILTAAQAATKLELPKGYEINLYASEEKFPLANPLAIRFDTRGRLWVANTPTWPHPHPGKQPTDSIVILEDSDRDGTVDKQTVFLDKLNMIHGFAFGDGGVYISQTPHIIHVKDTDGDDKADQFRMLLHGFGSEDVEHSISSHTWGRDGALYFMEGTFSHTQVETPYGPRRSLNAGVFRYNPRMQKLDVFVSYRFANPWGLVIDRWGQNIILDASGHRFHNMDILAANHIYPADRKGSHSFSVGKLGSSGGIGFISSRHFPDDVQGRFLSSQLCGHFRGTVWWDISEEGTTYEVKRVTPELLVSKDPHMGPLGTAIGPDGALYVVDFHTPLAENTSQPKRYKGRDHSHGRIWRITCSGRSLLKAPKIDGETVPALLEELRRAHELSTRDLVRRELQERDPEEVAPQLKKWIDDLEPSDPGHELALLEALWIYQGLQVVEPQLLRRLLKAKDYHVRAAATRVLRFWQEKIDDSLDLLSALVEDKHIRVRLQALLALGFSTSERARNIALGVTKHPMDDGLRKVLDDTLDYFERVKSAH